MPEKKMQIKNNPCQPADIIVSPKAKSTAKSTPIKLFDATAFKKAKFSGAQKNWIAQAGFEAKPGQICLLPNTDGQIDTVLFGHSTDQNPLDTGKLGNSLPAGKFHLELSQKQPKNDLHLHCLGFILGQYRFERYRKTTGKKQNSAQLSLPESVDKKVLLRETEAIFLARNLINTPANDLGPDALEAAARSLARSHKANIKTIKGDDLLKDNFGLIHAVGAAASQAPRLIDINWGNKNHPRLTLVGKGVCYDTGGLDIKPPSAMLNMKKDMGGAANIVALAQMVMAAKLKVRLRVLIPAVENSIAGNAFRPGDIITSRKGISVEIGNTDAEGRLVLADALCLADEDKPNLIIDMATLTGAARVALGPDLPPFYTDNDKLADKLQKAALALHDPLWRLPLWGGYTKMLASPVADTNNITSGGFAGSITAALFLKKFISDPKKWLHLDIFGWTPSAKPYAPTGGEAQGIRALYALIEKRYG